MFIFSEMFNHFGKAYAIISKTVKLVFVSFQDVCKITNFNPTAVKFIPSQVRHLSPSAVGLKLAITFFRWFKFTLKPHYSIVHGNLLSAIWDTFHWNFFVKFGLKTPYDIS